MKVAIVNSYVPFLRGGAEYLADSLKEKLLEYGHQAVLVQIPFKWEPASRILDSMLACRLLRLPNVERAIALRFPAYYLPHENKVLWLLHQFRQAYDLWGSAYQGLPADGEGLEIRSAITQADTNFLAEARKIFTNSEVTASRLQRFNGIGAEVLYPPLLEPTRFHCQEYGDYVFYPSRITASKRQHLVVESLKHTKSGVRLVIAGKAEAEEDLRRIEKIVRDNRLEDRVTVLHRFIAEEEKASFFARALACTYIPFDEDSYGYVTLESYQARKPVVACTDSGGTDVLVKDGITGYVVPPDPRAISGALDRLFSDKSKTQKMGEAGHDLVESLGINWDHVIQSLTR
jgi:glycosyltransferase involved in cell wall biosynthesis